MVLTEGFRAFPCSLQANAGIVPNKPPPRFFSQHVQFILYYSQLFSLASHLGDPGSVMWDLWWRKWNYGRYSSTSVSHAKSDSTNCSTSVNDFVIDAVRGGLIIFGLMKKTTSYGIEKMYFLYIFSLDLHTLMTLF
jgi:hypothetical protein